MKKRTSLLVLFLLFFRGRKCLHLFPSLRFPPLIRCFPFLAFRVFPFGNLLSSVRGYRFVNPFLEGHGGGGKRRKEKKKELDNGSPPPPCPWRRCLRRQGEEVRIWLTWLRRRRRPATPKKKRGDTPFMKRNFGAGPHWNWRQATRAPEGRENWRITEAFGLKIN